MKIQLPNGVKIILDNNISLEEKMILVKNLISEFSEEINNNWNSRAIRFFLDNLANYIVWHKDEEDKYTEDKEVVSIRKQKQMDGKLKSKESPFTYLSKQEKHLLFGEVSEDE